jgi:hypothetical protein
MPEWQNPMWNKFENSLGFFRRNPTLQNMKIFCIFFKVLSTKLDFPKYENCLHFSKGFFKETQSSQNMKTIFFLGFFKDLLSILVFLSKVLEFKISCFLRWKKWDHSTFNTQCHNFFLTLWMQHQNGKGRHFFLHIYSFTQIYSSMVMVSALKALDESEKTKNLPVCCVVFLILFCCFLCV